MEGLNEWIGWPLNQDVAIRRFCPARAELDHQADWDEATNDYDVNYYSSSPLNARIDTINTSLAASEVDDLVDSFINMEDDDQGLENNDGDKTDLLKESPNQIIDEFSMMLDDQVMEMMSSCEDLADDVTQNVNEVATSSIEEASPCPCPSHGVDQGLHLVHLLLACAEAVGCRDAHLADTMLAQISASLNSWGDSLHRVADCFAMGLKTRLSLFHSINSSVSTNLNFGDTDSVTREEKMEAFHLLHQTTPYVAFGFFAANEAICQAAQGKDSLHIIDLGMEHILQFPSLMRTLASRPEGPPKMRITGLIEDQNPGDLEPSVRSLVEEATSLGISLELSMVSELITPSLLTRENLMLREGETLFINSVMRLHKYVKESRGSLKAILQAIKKLGPTLLTVVEQDANHNGPFFLGRFLESLHYYSAIFDSLEASLPRNSPARMKIERLHFAEEICNIVAYEGSSRIERHERADQWRRQLGRAGYQVVGLKCLTQEKMMLSAYGCDGYTLASEKGCLLLGWKGRPIMLASAWQLHPTSSS